MGHYLNEVFINEKILTNRIYRKDAIVDMSIEVEEHSYRFLNMRL